MSVTVKNVLDFYCKNLHFIDLELTDGFAVTTSNRKTDHLRIAVQENVCFRSKSTGFEAYDFIHCALPEINADEISTETVFLGKVLSAPFLVSGMTGGCSEALKINRQLAEVCCETGIAMGVGSQRQMTEQIDLLESYRIVREKAPRSVIVGNIGAEQVTRQKDAEPFQRLVDCLEADALAVHLNPLQEMLQPEGSGQFRGVLSGIEMLVKNLSVPIIVKEVGCGISRSVARQLVDAGVTVIDVAGAGGTSWAAMESYRGADSALAEQFWDWGIPTAESLVMVRQMDDVQVIASGGIDNGVTAAKALALGAHMCGAALPFLRILDREGVTGLVSLIDTWRDALRLVMFLTASLTVNDLQRAGVLQRCE